MYEKLMNIISHFNENGESISEIKLRELTALIQPLLFDNSPEFQKEFDIIQSKLIPTDSAMKAILNKMLRYFAINKETLVQTSNAKLLSIYSSMFCIPVIFKNNSNTTKHMTIDITSFVPESFYEHNNLTVFESLVTANIQSLDARELARTHQYLTQFHGDSFNYMFDVIKKYILNPNPEEELELSFIFGIISSDTMIQPDTALLDPVLMLKLQTMIREYIELTYDTPSLVLPMLSFDEGLSTGIATFKNAKVELDITRAYNSLDTPENVVIRIRFDVDSQKMIAIGLQNEFPLFTIESELLDFDLTVAENIAIFEKLFKQNNFMKFI